MKTALILTLVLSSLIGLGVYVYSKHSKFTFDEPNQAFHNKLDNIAKKVNSLKTTWQAGENQRWQNMDIAGIKAHMGVLRESKSGINLEKVSTVVENLPKNFDSRKQWGSKCPSLNEVRDQSTCGSCWAFAAAESLSDRICIHTGEDVRLSTENLVSCCSSCGDGCNGGYPEAAMQYFVKTGLVTGDLFGDNNFCQAYSFPPCAHHVASTKYPPCKGEVPTPECKKKCDDDSKVKRPYNEDLYKGQKSYSVSSDPKAIMTEIMNNGPVEVAFTVYEDFVTYKSGVYQHVTGEQLGGHAVKMIGWGVENDTPYWLIVNSWNETWGDQGTFKILRGSNECGIEDEVVTALPQKKQKNDQ